jgi:uncharacterized protein with PIN domain
MIELPAGLEDDSDDLSDEEVAQAIALPNVDRVIAHLRAMRCPQCEKEVAPTSHARRRRVPSLYWRMRVRCSENHASVLVVVRMDWLHEDSLDSL